MLHLLFIRFGITTGQSNFALNGFIHEIHANQGNLMVVLSIDILGFVRIYMAVSFWKGLHRFFFFEWKKKTNLVKR